MPTGHSKYDAKDAFDDTVEQLSCDIPKQNMLLLLEYPTAKVEMEQALHWLSQPAYIFIP